MSDTTPSISLNEVAYVLRRVARGETEAVNVWGPYEPSAYAAACFLADGFEICIYNDAGSLDYIEWVKAPDGRYCEFDDWGHVLTQAELELEPWELAAMRPDLDILCPLDLLPEKEQEALSRALAAAGWK